MWQCVKILQVQAENQQLRAASAGKAAGAPGSSSAAGAAAGAGDAGPAALRKQLKEFTLNTQLELERKLKASVQGGSDITPKLQCTCCIVHLWEPVDCVAGSEQLLTECGYVQYVPLGWLPGQGVGLEQVCLVVAQSAPCSNSEGRHRAAGAEAVPVPVPPSPPLVQLLFGKARWRMPNRPRACRYCRAACACDPQL